MRTRLCLWYVGGYLAVAGAALLIAPEASLRLMFSNDNYGEIMPRWAR